MSLLTLATPAQAQGSEGEVPDSPGASDLSLDAGTDEEVDGDIDAMADPSDTDSSAQDADQAVLGGSLADFRGLAVAPGEGEGHQAKRCVSAGNEQHCLEVKIVETHDFGSADFASSSGPSSSAGLAAMNAVNIDPYPGWCLAKRNDGRVITRIKSCQIQDITWITSRIVGGVSTVTGEYDTTVGNLTVVGTGGRSWRSQTSIIGVDGWGDALLITFVANPSIVFGNTGNCVILENEFDAGQLAFGMSRNGTARFDGRRLAQQGSTSECTTRWEWTAIPPPSYPNDSFYVQEASTVRCDNRADGNIGVGCVIENHIPKVVFSQATIPNVADHIVQAQNSGLPGFRFRSPLTRTTDQAIINANRNAACPSSIPRPAGFSCDEYPFASTLQGGGQQRSFPGCQFDNIPQRTGPNGVSVCFVPEFENNSQGGTLGAEWRRWRVIDGDRFRVRVEA